MVRIPLLLALLGVGGCEINSGAEARTTRYVALTPAKVGQGKLAVMMIHKIRGRYPDAQESALLSLLESGFRGKGYDIVDIPPKADYGLLINLNQESHSYGYDVYAGGISQRMVYSHSITARLYELHPNGNPGDLLWHGFAVIGTSNPTTGKYDAELARLLIEKFPN